jgi:hypothetical protein
VEHDSADKGGSVAERLHGMAALWTLRVALVTVLVAVLMALAAPPALAKKDPCPIDDPTCDVKDKGEKKPRKPKPPVDPPPPPPV